MAVIGVDIGGSGIKAAPVDTRSGTLSGERVRVETPHPSLLPDVLNCLDEVVKDFPDTGPIGVTFPGVIVDGEIRTAANVDPSLIGVHLADAASEKLGRKAFVLNDADAAGLAEVRHGAAKGVDGVVISLTFGTGIGSAIFIDGHLVPNTELGHLEWKGKDAEKRAAASVKDEKGWSWDKWAGRASEYIDIINRLFTPALVVIGGGIANHPAHWIDKLDTQVRCVPAKLGNQAGIVGAAEAAATAFKVRPTTARKTPAKSALTKAPARSAAPRKSAS